jgi:ABC-type branched-subunit amino acid transport system substrate-binding protein
VHRQFALGGLGGDPLRYPLARWLMTQTLPTTQPSPPTGTGTDAAEQPLDAPDDPRGELADKLRARKLRWSDTRPMAHDADSAFAVGYRFVVWLVRKVVPATIYRAAASGRFPALGREYRWFMRQRYLAPVQSGRFLDFAARLTARGLAVEQPDEVRKLLVHAFLEDLRYAYRRRPWRLAGWRHTVYPVLLLKGVQAGNAGHTLLRVINDVRNETGLWDPLVVLASEVAQPAEIAELGRHRSRLWDAETACDLWEEALPAAQRRRSPDAWVFTLVADDQAGQRARTGSVPEFVAPRPPLFARRVVVVGVLLAVVAGALLWVGSRWDPGCRPHPLRDGVSVERSGGECVGFSDSADQVFSPDQGDLSAAERLIFRQNALALETFRRKGGRQPLVTLVYFGALTGQPTGPREKAYVSEREELEGMAVAQKERLPDSGGSDGQALLRIVIANGGNQMHHADQVAAMLVGLAADDRTVVGVVGLVESRATTAAALHRLNRAGLPTIATTLSADGFGANSRLYLQLVPSNTEQIDLVARYAAQEHLVGTHVYYSTAGTSLSDDLYVETLKTAAEQRFHLTATQFTQEVSLRGECDFRGLLFFAGRYSDFDEFLNGLRTVCVGNRGLPTHLVADDSVNRYMANDQKRLDAPNMPLVYVSKAALATCARLRADSGDEARSTFLQLIQKPDLLHPPRCTGPDEPAAGERLGLGYDATKMFLEAVQRLLDSNGDVAAVHPAVVFAELLRHNAASPYLGTTGTIRFNPDTGEPVHKRISLMLVKTIRVGGNADRSEPVEVYHCGMDRIDPAPAGPSTCARN